MICKNRGGLLSRYKVMTSLCKGTKVNPRECVKLDGHIQRSTFPWNFDCDPANYSFAVAIVEDKPVFEGDTVYHNVYVKCFITSGGCLNEGVNSLFFLSKNSVSFSWTPPEAKNLISDSKTIQINIPADSNDYLFIMSPKRGTVIKFI